MPGYISNCTESWARNFSFVNISDFPYTTAVNIFFISLSIPVLYTMFITQGTLKTNFTKKCGFRCWAPANYVLIILTAWNFVHRRKYPVDKYSLKCKIFSSNVSRPIYSLYYQFLCNCISLSSYTRTYIFYFYTYEILFKIYLTTFWCFSFFFLQIQWQIYGLYRK